MKRLLWTVALLTAFVFTMDAQNNYSRLWSKVQKAEKEGKPQTAAGYLRELEAQTIKAGDELEQLVVSENLYEDLRKYNWKEANAYYPTYSALSRRVLNDSLDRYLVKYKDHPRVMMLLYKQLRNHKDAADRKWKPAATGADYLAVRKEAQELLKHKYVGTYKSGIQSLIDGMDAASFSSESKGTMAPCDSVTYRLSARNVSRAEVKVFRMLDNKLFGEGYSDSSEATLRKNATLVSTQTIDGFNCEYNISEEQKVVVAFPQPGVYVVRFAAVEGRVVLDRVAADDVERERLRGERGAGRDADGLVDEVRVAARHLERLHAAEGAADDGVDALEAELAQEHAVDVDDVRDGDLGEARAVGRPGLGVDRRGAGRAHAAAEDVGADDEEAVRVDAAAGAGHAGPPAGVAVVALVAAGDVRVAGERVADEHDVVALGRELAARLVGDIHLAEDAALLEAEPPVRQVEPEEAGLCDGRCAHGGAHSSRPPPAVQTILAFRAEIR